MNLVQQEKVIAGCRIFQGSGFIGADCLSDRTNEEIGAAADRVTKERLHRAEIHPDAWQAVLIRDPQQTTAKLAAVAGDRYSYRELDDFTDLIARTVQGAPEVAKVERKGVLPEQVYLDYSQERLVEYGVKPADLKNILGARNTTLPAGSARSRSAGHSDQSIREISE